MKKFLIFTGGFIAGAFATLAFSYSMFQENEPIDQGLPGLSIFSEKGDCITPTKKHKHAEIEILQVIDSDKALGSIKYYSVVNLIGGESYRRYDYDDGVTVLLTNDEGKSYYDNQKFDVSKKCVRQIGTFQYTNRIESEKTVPLVIIE